MTNGGTVVGTAIKIKKRGPLLFAGCGTWSMVSRFLDWGMKGCVGDHPPMNHEDFNAAGFIFMPDGTILSFEPSGPSVHLCDYFAEGSGRDLAMGALAFGASAIEAIEVAKEHDIYTGGNVQVLTHD